MTDERWDKLDALAAAATPGPWRAETEWCDCGDGYGCSHGEYPTRLVATSVKVKRNPGSDFEREESAAIADFMESQEATVETAAFIAACDPATIRDLVAAARRGEEIGNVARLKRNVRFIGGDPPKFADDEEWVAVPSEDFDALHAALHPEDGA